MNEYVMIWGNERSFCYGDTPEEAFRELDPNYKIGTTYLHLTLVPLPSKLDLMIVDEGDGVNERRN